MSSTQEEVATAAEQTVYPSLSEIKATCLGCLSKHQSELKKRKREEKKVEQKNKKQKLEDDKIKRLQEKEANKKLDGDELKKKRAEKRELKKSKIQELEKSPAEPKTPSPKNKKRNHIELTKEEARVQVLPVNKELLVDDKMHLRMTGTCPICDKSVSRFLSLKNISDEDLQEHLSLSREEFKEKKRALKQKQD